MEFTLVFFIFPATVVVSSIIGYVVTKKWFAIPVLTLIVFTILTRTVFNDSFFIWVILYTLLSVAVSLIMRATKA